MVLVFLLFSTAVFANSSGEKNFEHYYGPNDPGFKVTRQQKVIFEDERQQDSYINQRIQADIFELQEFLQGEFTEALYCPQSQFVANYDYFYYLARLTTLSYLFEAFQAYEFTGKQLGVTNLCQYEWKETFKGCRPKSKDMKIFLKNVDVVLKKLDPVYVPLEQSKKSYLRKWLTQVKKRPMDLVGRRVRSYCQGHECGNLQISSLPKIMKDICDQDMSLLKTVCNENDKLYGASYIPELYPLIVRSSALRAIKDSEIAAGCLRRFITSGSQYERKHLELKPIFTSLYSRNIAERRQFERGRLFPVGALREFRQKGLDNIFEEFNEEKKQIAAVKVEKERKLEPIKFEKIELPKFKKPKRQKTKKVKKETKKKSPVKKSSFLVASNFLKSYGLRQVSLDMNKFKFDYVFTLEQEDKFTPIVIRMSSVETLKKMKKDDKVGSVKAPFPLRFLKYMIDKNMHQSLFNIVQVVGDQFYVQNDIDSGVKNLDYIELKNDASTQYQWQINLLEGPNTI